MENGLKIKNNVFVDHRGVFAPLSLNSLGVKWIQSNISINPNKGTFRGLHFQKGDFAQSKLIKVINGCIIDFIVDIRLESPDYLKVFKYILLPGDELLVPKGFAHGFLTTEDNTVVQYLVDNIYSPENEGSIYWGEFNDVREVIKEFMDGKLNEDLLIISDKDLQTKNFEFN
jgi:dTDP-4-dehydrorhamnose 3,5-epimerase